MSSLVLSRTNAKMPAIGFSLCKIPKAICADTVYNAIKIGYRHLESFCDYQNEKEAGEGVRRAIKDGLVRREDIFITYKLWNVPDAHLYIKATAKDRLDSWGLDHFDLCFVHFLFTLEYVCPGHRSPFVLSSDDGKIHVEKETWHVIEELVDEGLVKNIGLSNVYDSALLLEVLRYAKIPPQVLQVDIHPSLIQDPLVEFAKRHGMAVTAYSDFELPSSFELSTDRGAASFFKHDVVTSIAKARSKTPGQIILAWALAQNIAVIPNHSQSVENLEAADIRLATEEVERISDLGLKLMEHFQTFYEHD